MDSYESRVMEIVHSARERVTMLAVELHKEEEKYRESAVREIDQLEQSLKLSAENKKQADATENIAKRNRAEEPSWMEDDDFSETTWLEGF